MQEEIISYHPIGKGPTASASFAGKDRDVAWRITPHVNAENVRLPKNWQWQSLAVQQTIRSPKCDGGGKRDRESPFEIRPFFLIRFPKRWPRVPFVGRPIS